MLVIITMFPYRSSIARIVVESGAASLLVRISLIAHRIFRPVDGKIIPARPPPPKGVPGRPPPPKLSATKISSQKDALSRSTSYVAYDKKPSKLRLGPKRTKSQLIKKQDPALPPRPRPGHPLYNKYVVRAEIFCNLFMEQ